jgi:hypothetical protein
MALHMESRGYSPRHMVKQTIEKYKTGIKDAVNMYFDAMKDEMVALNDSINTPDDVARYSHKVAQCPR